MSMPNDLNDLLRIIINYYKDLKSQKSVNQTSIDMKINRIYLKGLFDGLYISGLAVKIIDQKQYNSYKLDIEKLKRILNERSL